MATSDESADQAFRARVIQIAADRLAADERLRAEDEARMLRGNGNLLASYLNKDPHGQA